MDLTSAKNKGAIIGFGAICPSFATQGAFVVIKRAQNRRHIEGSLDLSVMHLHLHNIDVHGRLCAHTLMHRLQEYIALLE